MELIDDRNWFEVPTIHAICACLNCHNAWDHSNGMDYWAKHGCELCYELFEENYANN